MSNTEPGRPAFPLPLGNQNVYLGVAGMTIREYAAIKLKVPDSGTDWLDKMITTSLRDDFAAKAMQGMLANPNQDYAPLTIKAQAAVVEGAYEMAEAMLEARSK